MPIIVELTEQADAYSLPQAEIVRAGWGADTVTGSIYDDVIYGNQNLDLILGGLGNDTLFGGQNDGPAGIDGVLRQGIDTIHSGGGNDVVYGNNGADILYAGSGDDTLYGGQDNDTIYGGNSYNNSNEVIYGNRGDDTIIDGSDFIFYRRLSGADRFDGGAGDDFIQSKGGGDTLIGGAGADIFDIDAEEYFTHPQFMEIIADFSEAEGDRIDLQGYGYTAAQLVSMTSLAEAGKMVLSFAGPNPDPNQISRPGAITIFTGAGVTQASESWFIV